MAPCMHRHSTKVFNSDVTLIESYEAYIDERFVILPLVGRDIEAYETEQAVYVA
jgi:hypothetical protein